MTPTCKTILAILVLVAVQAEAQNPIVRDIFTADPAPLVYKDTVFLYAGQDTAAVGTDSYKMPDWHVYTSTDMVNWKDRGACLSPLAFSWSAGGAFASQCIERNGKFYWYVSVLHKSNEASKGGCAIGVAIADSPAGPFRDAIGKALITNEMTTDMKHSWDDLDPTVFVDDDGQAYLFWGNGSCKYAKLKENMVELDGPIKTFKPENFTEGSWVYKRNNLYYLAYAAGMPETIEYCTATSIHGPWTHRGTLQDKVNNSFTTHPGIIDYKGRSYFFYHNGALPTGGGYRRSVCVDYLNYNADGTMQKVIQTTEGVAAVTVNNGDGQARNPIIFADVPDMSMIRVDDTYYMSSTTMHMSPGVPIMKSKDLVNWTLVSYAYDILDDMGPLNLENGKNTYGHGSWASSLRYHNGTYYVSTFAGTTGKTYIYTTKDIEKGPWKKISFKPSLHDHSLYFAEDGKTYMLYGNGKIMIAELAEDLSGIKPGTTPKVLIENASAPAGNNVGLQAEGSQLFRVNGKFYLFNICWPRGGMRTVTIHRADKLEGPWEGRVALQDLGVAQGGLINTPEGNWYAYLFRDYGAVGRIPYWVPVKWEDQWPVLGVNGKVPEQLDLPAGKGLIPGIVVSDEFSRKKGEPLLPLAWQWNHNPDNLNWSLSKRPGYLRLTTGRTDSSVTQARNTLTQRCFGPRSSGATAIDVSRMKDGDCAGLLLLQKKYGWVGVKMENGEKRIVMISAESGTAVEIESLPLKGKKIHLRADCNFENLADTANFYYSTDGKNWKRIGGNLKMSYTIPHFMGYRFGLFNYATRTTGGYTDFDYFHIGDKF